MEKTIEDMRFELARWITLPDATPNDMIRGLWQCYKMATDERLPQHVRSTMEFLFTTFESSNGDWGLKYEEMRALVMRNAHDEHDLMGEWVDSDEMDASA